MRQRESEYWDNEAQTRILGGLSDNIWKRQHIISRLLNCDLIGQSVLEIGIGTGTAFAAIKVGLLGQFDYIGTDVSPIFCEEVAKQFHLRTCNTDVTALPEIEGGFTRIVALDSLEHVRPEDRPGGYREISRVMAEHGSILINMPVEETLHNREFDHEIGINDIAEMSEITGCSVRKYEPYEATMKNGAQLRYIWVELER